MKLDGDLACTGDFEDARRAVPIEGNLGVRIVVDEQNVALAALTDQSLQVLDGSDGSGGVVWIIEVENLRPP
jgi:hypothetical protein